MTVTFPMNVSQSASLLSSDYPFTIIHDDLVINIFFDVLETEQEVTLYLPEVVDAHYVNQVIIDAKHDPVGLTKATLLNQEDLIIAP